MRLASGPDSIVLREGYRENGSTLPPRLRRFTSNGRYTDGNLCLEQGYAAQPLP
jgi:hypothetical protein